LIPDDAVKREFVRQGEVQTPAEIVTVAVLSEKVRRVVVTAGEFRAEGQRL
jgi:hypothetical protein